MTAVGTSVQRRETVVRRVRILLALFIVGLVVSGLTAFALETELRVLSMLLGIDPSEPPGNYVGLRHWIAQVAAALTEVYAKYPFIAYGTDWLAFAHLVIAVAFIGPLRDPVRNQWVVTFGLRVCRRRADGPHRWSRPGDTVLLASHRLQLRALRCHTIGLGSPEY
jgi:hypothetical protein